MSVNDELRLSFRLPNGEEIERIGATVRRVEWQNDRILVGTSFDPRHPKLPAIKDYIDVVLERLVPLSR